ncbi:hypothetical protein CUMW_277790 [Citrus unshiu]|uniref:Uncharacterized protein n=1 Tax=Citrus unshiu TaxID=55188 RepID=A0A2H5N421_CITUN|nr:hypothetical protein CUMW_277790 [Citrus unshiu]
MLYVSAAALVYHVFKEREYWRVQVKFLRGKGKRFVSWNSMICWICAAWSTQRMLLSRAGMLENSHEISSTECSFAASVNCVANCLGCSAVFTDI